MSNTTTAIAIRDDQFTFDDLQKKALVHLGVDRASDADLAVFFHTCKRTGLDPFARQIYMIQRSGKQTIQTGIDGYRLIARRAAGPAGYGYGITEWCGKDGQWRDVWLDSEPPAAARVTVIRGSHHFPAVATFSEYAQTSSPMWKRMPANQLAKCAEALALRKAFPLDLSGVYVEDEMHQADTPARENPAPAQRMTAADFTQTQQAEQGADVTDAEVVEDTLDADAAWVAGEQA